MDKYNFIKYITTIIFLFVAGNLFYIQVIKNDYYKEKVIKYTEKKIYGVTAPRGRILDRNGKIIVDNKPVKVIYFQNNSNISKEEELSTVKKLANLLEINSKKVTKDMIKEYYIILNGDKGLVKREEYILYNNDQLSESDLRKIKFDRISDNDIKSINKEEAYIYYLMHNGYSYEEKIIKENASDTEFAKVAENLQYIKGAGVKLSWKRVYPYGNTLKGILGSVGKIPEEKKEEYISKGYQINDLVGLSYLEYEYDDYLKGEKDEYVKHQDGTYDLVKEGKRGNDIYLNIDIELQKDIESIIIKNIKKSKNEPNTKYLDKSYVIVEDTNTGAILALSGKQYIKGTVYDNSLGTITSSYSAGSTIKGASHIVGYNTGALKIGEVRSDDCIKLKNTPKKCSFMRLGTLNDLTALKRSSNTYQFRTALKVGGANYHYDASIKVNPKAFDTYRNTFKEFGLGTYTEIDIYGEKLGVKGNKTDTGLLLDLAIGQYDTYTPIQLSQYITTIANDGIRIKPYLISKVVDADNNIIYSSDRTELNKVNTNSKYMQRVKLGLKMVLESGGTGVGYINSKYKPAGKTGTSQSFIDTNLDGKIDTGTISTLFVGYLPYNKPKVSFTVICPDASTYSNIIYTTPISKRIMQEVEQSYFKRYKP